MKKLALIIVLFYCFTESNAQKKSKEKEVVPVADTVILTPREKLVQLALANNTDVKILTNNQNVALYNARKARWDWINHVTLSGNLNEFVLDKSSTEGQAQPAFFPRYNISLTLPLGVLAIRSNDVKIANHKLNNSTLEIRKEEQSLKNKVLTMYEKLSALSGFDLHSE